MAEKRGRVVRPALIDYANGEPLTADDIAEQTADPVPASLEPRTEAEERCHATKAGTVLLDTYAIETATCCGLAFKAHDETVTDHVVQSYRLWNAQLHDMVDAIEEQAATEARRELLAKVEAFIVSHDKAWHHPNVSYCDGHCEPLRAMRRLIEESDRD